MRLRKSNPVYKYADRGGYYSDSSTSSATVSGVALKTLYLLVIIALFALISAFRVDVESFTMTNMIAVLIVAPIIAIIAVIFTHRKPQIGFVTTFVYAVAEGTFIGFISALYTFLYGNDIVTTALLGTFGVLAGMLFLFSTGLFKVTSFFRKLLMSALFGLIIASLLIFALSFTGLSYATFSGLYFGIVLLSVIVSSLFLLYDFDTISNYVSAGAPKSTEWSLSLGLVVTIVWLYLELLRLVAILAGRRD